MKTKIKYLLVLVLASFVFAGCCTMHKTAQWEYTTLQMVPLPSNDKTLNGYGKDGWILVSITPLRADSQDGGVGECAYVFKRLKH
jgi:uncharacterized lipoprotein YajG